MTIFFNRLNSLASQQVKACAGRRCPDYLPGFTRFYALYSGDELVDTVENIARDVGGFLRANEKALPMLRFSQLRRARREIWFVQDKKIASKRALNRIGFFE